MNTIEIKGCSNCPMCDANDMASGYSCQLYRRMGDNDMIPNYNYNDNHIKENKRFQPETPNWCPIQGEGVTLKRT